MSIDLEQAETFLQILDPLAYLREEFYDLPDGFTFQTFDDNKDRKERSLARKPHGTLKELGDELCRLNALGAGVFVTVNETDTKGRSAGNITRIRAVWIEDDTGMHIPLPITPHLITETSPGKFHKLFLVKGLSFEGHQKVQDALVANYGSDPNARDISRVLRVPGFYHNKGRPFKVKLLEANKMPAYSAEKVMAAFNSRSNTISRVSEEFEPMTLRDAQLPLSDITLANCIQYLPEPGEQSRKEWLEVGMILHHQFEGSLEALDIFDAWSQKVREYKGFEDVLKEWETFGKQSNRCDITFRTLIDRYNKKAVTIDNKSAVKAAELLRKCTNYMELVCIVAPKLQRLCDGNVVLEKDFRVALIARYAELRPGDVLSKQEAIKAMRTRREHSRLNEGEVLGLDNPNTPVWARNWVWVSSEEEFFNTVTRVRLKQVGFKGHFDSFLPVGDNAPKDSAKYLRDNNLIPKVMTSLYAPNFDRVFTYNDVSYVNTYNNYYGAKVPERLDDLSATALDAVGLFRQHIENICGGWNREAQLLCNFFKVCSQPKPSKIRWAPVLIGSYGDGKSLFSTFMARAVGSDNVRLISNAEVIKSADSGISSWAEGSVFGFIEELKLHGHNRHDVVNALKPYITNSDVPCRKMYKESRNIPNTVNYFITSNYVDCVPLEAGDRRMFMLQSKLMLAGLDDNYFKRLHWAIEHHAGDIVCWLRSIEDHADFDIDGHAPMTEIKASVIELHADDLTEVVAEILADSTEALYCSDAICFAPLFERLLVTMNGALKADQDYKLARALSALGYMKLPRASILGHRQRIWMKRDKGNFSVDAARKIFESRVTLDDSI